MKNKLIELIKTNQLRTNFPKFRVKNNIKIHVRIRENKKKRIQIFKNLIINKKKSNTKKTFTIKKISFKIDINKTFPLHSPLISTIKIIKSNKIKKTKLYYMKNRTNKSTRLKKIKK